MSAQNTLANGTPTCGCGKSLHMPYCDGSHGRSPAQYEEWERQTAQENKDKASSTMPPEK